MPQLTFVGSRVRISISDPWDLASENSDAIHGEVIEYDEKLRPVFLVALDHAIKQGAKLAPRVLATLRHVGVDPYALNLGAEIACGFYGVPDSYEMSEYVDHGEPKGAVYFIGGMKFCSKKIGPERRGGHAGSR